MPVEKVGIYTLSQKSPTTNNKLAQRNMMFCIFAYNIGSVFCMTPWYDFKNHVLKHPLFNKVYASIYGFCLGVLLVTALIIKEEKVYRNNFDRLLSTCSEIISMVLTEFMIFGSMFLKQNIYHCYIKKNWAHLSDFSYASDSITMFYIQFIVGHITFVAIFIFKWYVWITVFNFSYISLTFFSNVVSAYYCFLPALIASNQALIIKSKYDCLNNLVVKQTDTSLKTTEKQIVANLIEMGKLFRRTTELVDYFNKIFGWVAVFMFWHSIVEFLRCPSLFLRAKNDPEIFWTLFVSVLLTSSFSLGESVYLIWCCALSSHAGKKLAPICIKLQENFEADSKARQELFKLAEVAKVYEPRYTAASFFVISKGTILGLINIATTYLIVIVQFNGVLKEISN